MNLLPKSKLIVAFKKSVVVAAKVRIWRKPKIVKSLQYEWSEKSLEKVFERIIKDFKASRLRILVGEEYSYLLGLKIPKDVSLDKEREVVYGKLIERVPERLKNYDWDFKELGVVGDERRIVAFAPVKDFFQKLSSVVEKLDIRVEAVEAEAMAETRNKNPILGIALKKDIEGDDEDVLNIKPLYSPDSEDKDEDEEEDKKTSKTTIILVFIIIILLIILGVVLNRNRKNDEENQNPANEAEVIEEIVEIATPTPTATPTTAEEVSLSNLSVQVLNGSEEVGVQEEVNEILQAEGFEDLVTGNAENSNYQETQVFLKEGVDNSVYETIERALNSEYEVVRVDEELIEEDGFDVVIILGEKI